MFNIGTKPIKINIMIQKKLDEDIVLSAMFSDSAYMKPIADTIHKIIDAIFIFSLLKNSY